MYLTAKRYLWSYPEDGPDAKIADAIAGMFPEIDGNATKDVFSNRPFRVNQVECEVGYWRKANAIHNWFVKNVQNGVDECQPTRLEWEDLDQLRQDCKKVKEDNSRAETLLPPAAGFFFGSTELDEWYFRSLDTTIDTIDKIEKALVTEQLDDGTRYSKWDFEYQSSW